MVARERSSAALQRINTLTTDSAALFESAFSGCQGVCLDVPEDARQPPPAASSVPQKAQVVVIAVRISSTKSLDRVPGFTRQVIQSQLSLRNSKATQEFRRKCPDVKEFYFIAVEVGSKCNQKTDTVLFTILDQRFNDLLDAVGSDKELTDDSYDSIISVDGLRALFKQYVLGPLTRGDIYGNEGGCILVLEDPGETRGGVWTLAKDMPSTPVNVEESGVVLYYAALDRMHPNVPMQFMAPRPGVVNTVAVHSSDLITFVDAHPEFRHQPTGLLDVTTPADRDIVKMIVCAQPVATMTYCASATLTEEQIVEAADGD